MTREHYFSEFPPITVACGATAEFDVESGISYRCTTCFAVIGSIGMPRECKEAEEKEQMWKILSEGNKT